MLSIYCRTRVPVYGSEQAIEYAASSSLTPIPAPRAQIGHPSLSERRTAPFAFLQGRPHADLNKATSRCVPTSASTSWSSSFQSYGCPINSIGACGPSRCEMGGRTRTFPSPCFALLTSLFDGTQIPYEPPQFLLWLNAQYMRVSQRFSGRNSNAINAIEALALRINATRARMISAGSARAIPFARGWRMRLLRS